jgi:hypothetical protein
VKASAARLASFAPRPVLALALGCLACMPALRASAQEAGTAVYVRTDSDDTTVITPRLRVATELAEGTVAEVAYVVDVWTSASVDVDAAYSDLPIDATSTASKRITEQRDEIDLALRKELSDLRLRASYRHSSEPDYSSNGGSVGFERDFADKSATLALDLTGTFDRVGRVGLPSFDEPATVLDARVAFTQVLDPDTLVQGVYEIGRAEGYLASPYRFVGIGSDDGTCGGAGVFDCVPEINPERRLSHAMALRVRAALTDALSIGADYRFYVDDWELTSHTAEARFSFLPDGDGELALRYRFYTQSAAEHYQPTYAALDEGAFYTRDKELSPLHNHRVMLDLGRDFAIGSSSLRVVLALGPTFYTYRDYPLLDSATAFESTLSAVFVR